MGFRHEYVLIEKEKVNIFKDFTHESLINYANSNGIEVDVDEDYSSVYIGDLLGHEGKTVFEFGKLYTGNVLEEITKDATSNNLFQDDDLINWYQDYDLYVVGRQSVINAINAYKDKIKANLESDLKNFELDYFHDQTTQKLRLFDYMIDINPESDKLTNSWYCEYTIFNLVHILKTVDWDKYDLIVYGH